VTPKSSYYSWTNFPRCETPEIEIPTCRAASAIGCDKTDANLFLNFGPPKIAVRFEIGKIVKYASLNSDQLNLILGKNLARLLRIEPKPSASKTMERVVAS
jgi:hypothetical protein